MTTMNNTRIHLYKTRASVRLATDSLREVVEIARRDSRFELMMKRRNITAFLSPTDSPVRISPIIEKPFKINKAKEHLQKLIKYKAEKAKQLEKQKAQSKPLFKVHHVQHSPVTNYTKIYSQIKGKRIDAGFKLAPSSNHKFKPPVNVKPINMVNGEKVNIKKKLDFCENPLDKDKSLKGKKANTSRLNSIKTEKTGKIVKNVEDKEVQKSKTIVNKYLTHNNEISKSLKSNNFLMLGKAEHSNETTLDLELGVKTLLLGEPKTPERGLSDVISNKENGTKWISPFVTVSRGKDAATKEYHDKKNKSDEACTYFAQLLYSETTRLTELCDKWKTYEVEEKPPEDACDMIHMAIGQTELLLKKKFKKFEELIKICESGEGEQKVNRFDLLGFWDIAFMEVINLDKRFSNLTRLKNNNWEELLPTPIIKKTKKKTVLKKREIKSSLRDIIREARKKNVQTDEKNFSPAANLITTRKLSNISNLSIKVEKTPITKCNTAITPKSILKPQASSISRCKSVLFADHNKENSPDLITFTPVSAPRRSIRIRSKNTNN